jgi:hypothetical protein
MPFSAHFMTMYSFLPMIVSSLSLNLGLGSSARNCFCESSVSNSTKTVGTEKLLKRNLTGIVQVAKVLNVDTGLKLVGGRILQAVEEIEGTGLPILVAFFCGDGERLCALYCLVASAGVFAVVYNDEILAITKRGNNRRVWAEAAHALEVCDVLD